MHTGDDRDLADAYLVGTKQYERRDRR